MIVSYLEKKIKNRKLPAGRRRNNEMIFTAVESAKSKVIVSAIANPILITKAPAWLKITNVPKTI